MSATINFQGSSAYMTGPQGDTGPSGVMTAATFTTHGSTLQTVYNVRDYGAVGDGVTDDTSSITSAITAADTAGGGIIFFPKGSYAISSSQTIYTKSNTIMRGASEGSVTILMGSGSVFRQQSISNNIFENLNFSTTNFPAIRAVSGTNFKYLNCSFTGAGDSTYGILNFYGAYGASGDISNVLVQDCTFSNVTGTARTIHVYPNNSHVYNNFYFIRNSFTNTAGTAIALDTYSTINNTWVLNNQFTNLVAGTHYYDAAVAVGTTTSATVPYVQGLFVHNNVYKNTVDQSAAVGAGGLGEGFLWFYCCKNVEASGNKLYGNWTIANDSSHAGQGPAFAPGRTTYPTEDTKIWGNYIEGFDATWDPDSMLYADVWDNTAKNCGEAWNLGYNQQSYVNVHHNTSIECGYRDVASYATTYILANSSKVKCKYQFNTHTYSGTGVTSVIAATGHAFDNSDVTVSDNTFIFTSSTISNFYSSQYTDSITPTILNTHNNRVIDSTGTVKNGSYVNWDVDFQSNNNVQRLRHSTGNFLSNAAFQRWDNGTSVPPDAWSIYGDVTIARSSTTTVGDYSSQLTFGTANTGGYEQAVGSSTFVDYTYSCYVQRLSGTGTARLVADMDVAPYTEFASVNLSTTAGWQLATLTVKPAAGTKLRFSVKSGSAAASVWLISECMLQESKGVATTFQYAALDDSNNQNVYGDKYFGFISAYNAQITTNMLVADDPYAAGWSANAAVPTKNAIYNKVQTLAPLASPSFTGTPIAPTAAGATSTTQIATTAFVEGEIVSNATPDATASVKGKSQLTNDLGGTASAPTVVATHLLTALPVAQGGTATTTAFTLGSLLFAGASGVYSQNNSKLFWDNTNFRLGIGTASPTKTIELQTGLNDFGIRAFTGGGTNGDKAGIGLGVGTTELTKAGLIMERVGTWGYGKLHIVNNVSATNVAATTADARITLDDIGNVGISKTSANSILQVGGPIATALSAKTTSYTVTATDSVLTSDATSGAVTFTLPTAASITGRVYTFKRIDASANNTIIDGNASETIDGALTKTITTQWGFISIVSNGTNWIITASGGTIT